MYIFSFSSFKIFQNHPHFTQKVNISKSPISQNEVSEECHQNHVGRLLLNADSWAPPHLILVYVKTVEPLP